MATAQKDASKSTNKNKSAQQGTEGGGKKGPTMLERVFRSVSAADRFMKKWTKRVGAWKQADKEAEALGMRFESAEVLIGEVKNELEKLHSKGWTPPQIAGVGGGSGKKIDFAPDVQVWIKEKKRESYLAAFSAADLDKLFIDKIYGTKMMVRIGGRTENGKVARMIGFVPKGDVTTRQPTIGDVTKAA